MRVQERKGTAGHSGSEHSRGSGGERLPVSTRERKPALAALAVLLILVGALGATVLVLRAGDRVEVVRLTKQVQAGNAISDDDVESVMVADDSSIHYVRWSQLGELERLRAVNTLVPGTLLIGEMFTGKAGLPAGKATVGLALKDGQYPIGLKAGDVVAAYRVKGANGGSSSGSSNSSGAAGADSDVIVAHAVVTQVTPQGGSTLSSGDLPVTVTVSSDQAAALAQASSNGEVALVLVPANG